MRLTVVAITGATILGASLSHGFQVKPPVSRKAFIPHPHRDIKFTRLMQSEPLKFIESNGVSTGYNSVPQEFATEYDLDESTPFVELELNPADEGAVLYQGDDWEGKYSDQDLEWRLEDDDHQPQSRGGPVRVWNDKDRPPLELLQTWTQEYIDAMDLAGGMTRISVGVEQYLAEEYVHTTPDIGPLGKTDYMELMRYYNHNGLDLGSAIPDLTADYEGWHVDPHNPWRIWAICRYSGTHTGVAVDPDSGLQLSPSTNNEYKGVRFTTGPELQSFLWNPDKTLRWQTNGYVGDEYTGSNQGRGGLKGLLISMGLPRLFVQVLEPVRKAKSWMSQFGSSSSGQEQPRQKAPRSKSPYSSLPQWWHDREKADLNIHA
jgi:hypothetical protein